MRIEWCGDSKFYVFSDTLGDDIEYQFYIYNDYHKVPAFHIISSNEIVDFCIRLDKASYHQESSIVYKYGYPEAIDEFLRKEYKDGGTNWDRLTAVAQYCYPNYKKIEQPDYSKLNENPISRRSFIDAIKTKLTA